MDGLAFFICFLLLLLFSVYIGFLVGSWAGKRVVTSRDYWLYNLAFIAGAVFAVAFIAWPAMLYAVPLGFLPGCLTGLKMGFGESSGPWKLTDRFFNVNKAHRDASERGGGEARRRRARSGDAAPDLVSVTENPSTPSKDGTSQPQGAKHKNRKKR